jgi:hypothetical protein
VSQPEKHVAAKPYDPTLKVLVKTTPEEWPVLAGQPRAHHRHRCRHRHDQRGR